jgi:hypothetical protein
MRVLGQLVYVMVASLLFLGIAGCSRTQDPDAALGSASEGTSDPASPSEVAVATSSEVAASPSEVAGPSSEVSSQARPGGLPRNTGQPRQDTQAPPDLPPVLASPINVPDFGGIVGADFKQQLASGFIEDEIRRACGDGTVCLKVGTKLDNKEGGTPCQIAQLPKGKAQRGSTIYFVLQAPCADDADTPTEETQTARVP